MFILVASIPVFDLSLTELFVGWEGVKGALIKRVQSIGV